MAKHSLFYLSELRAQCGVFEKGLEREDDVLDAALRLFAVGDRRGGWREEELERQMHRLGAARDDAVRAEQLGGGLAAPRRAQTAARPRSKLCELRLL